MDTPHITIEQLLQHQDWLHRFVRRMVNDDFSADDMVQATFAEALESPDAGKVDLKSWLAGTARNLIYTQWRTDTRRRKREERVAMPTEAIRNRSSEITEYFAETNKAIGQLPEQERVVILLRYLQEMKPKQIAQELEMPVDGVYRLLESSRSKLRGRMEQRFGKGWQALGAGLLALPTAPAATQGSSTSAAAKSQSPLLFAAGIAVLAVGTAGYWIYGGGGTGTDGGPGMDAPFASTVAQVDDLQDQAPTRSSTSLGLQSGQTVHVRAITQDGTPLEHARLELHHEGMAVDPLQATTGEDGEAVFSPPADATGFYLTGRADGLWTTSLHMDRPFGSTHELVFQVGQLPLEYVVDEGTPGVTLEVTGVAYPPSRQQWFGSITTDGNGRATFPVPVHGQYRVSAVDSLGRDTEATIEYGPGFQPAPAEVSYQAPMPLEIEVVVKGTTTILDSAKFFLSEEAQRVEGKRLYTYQELPIVGGRLLNPNPSKAWRYGLVVRAAGHRDARVSVHGQQEGALQVYLDPIRHEQARLTSPMEGVQWSDLQILETVPLFSFQPLGRGWGPSMNGTVLQSLDVSPDGVFQLPRVVDGEDGRFHLIAMDSQGRRHVAMDLRAELRTKALPEFSMTLSTEGALRFLAPSAWPLSTSERIQGGWMGALDHPSHRLAPDAQGVFSVPGSIGSLTWVLYQTRDLHYRQIQRIPPQEVEAPVHLVDYPRDAQLQGTLVHADGSSLPPETVIRARFRGHLDAYDLPGGSEAEFLLLLRPDGHHIQSVRCPQGSYDLELRYEDHVIEFEDVRTGADFHLRIPDLQMVMAHARDRDSGLPLHATLYRIPEGGHEKVHVKWTNARSGHVATVYSEFLDLSRWVLAMPGYEPYVLHQAIPGMMFTADLVPGRKLRLEPATLDIEPVEGNRWICSTWGDAADPRQAYINISGDRIIHLHAPAAEHEMLEIGPHGALTGRSFLVHEDGSLTDTSS